MKLPLVRGDTGGNAEIEQVRRRLDQNIEQRCCDKKEAGQKRKKWHPVRHGPDWARETSPGKLSRRAVRLEPGKKPNNTSRKASSLLLELFSSKYPWIKIFQ